MWNPLNLLKSASTASDGPQTTTNPVDLANWAVFSDAGEPLVLLGQALLERCDLHGAQTLQRFGLETVWFARYVGRGQDIKNPVKGKIKHFEQSQLRLKVTPLEGDAQSWRTTYEAAFVEHLLNKLELRTTPDKLAVETDETCCQSPCFGCMVYQSEPLAQQKD